MSSEWDKSSIKELLECYQKEENLYNKNHKHYHNKQARSSSLENIHNKVKKIRPETALNDINKKIQTLRTQYGQEINKIEKTATSTFPYRPKVWWFQHMSWIGDFMKTRNDPTPLSKRASIAKPDDNEDTREEVVFHIENVSNAGNISATEIEFAEYDSNDMKSPPAKKPKTYETKSKRDEREDEELETTIEYTLINEDQGTNDADNTKINLSCVKERNFDKNKRRSKAFGKYIATLLMEIDDDGIFFDLQSTITNAIHEASKKQTTNS